MALYLIRHATAGSRGIYTGNDLERPLDDKGREQAREIASQLVACGVTALLSSPAARCVETIEPLSKKLGVSIEVSAALIEGQSAARALDLIHDLVTADTTAALCSHGDIIPDTIQTLARNGVEVSVVRGWSKGSVWRLDSVDGALVSATFMGPH